MIIRLLVAEHKLVVPVVLDFLRELSRNGFSYDIKPMVAKTITEAYAMLYEADMALIDIGEKERADLAITALIRERIPVIATSALHDIREHEGLGFLSKPEFNLKKLRRKLEEFAALITNSDGEKAFAI